MKKLIKLFFVAAAFAGLVACEDELGTTLIEGVTGDYAYIVGGTEASYRATTCEVFHTPELEDGTVEMTITVALTHAQDAATTITIAHDDDKIDSAYEPFPSGVLDYATSVTIPAGETQAEIVVSIAQANFPELVEPQYEAVFVITDVTGDVKISSNSNSQILYTIVETIDPADDEIYISYAEYDHLLKRYNDGQSSTTSISHTITINGTEEAYKSFDIALKVDNSLVEAFNAENGTSYVALDDISIVDITTATMETGATSTSATITITDENRNEKMTDAAGYLIPIVIEDVDIATISPNTEVVYIIVKVQYIDASMSYFSALYLGDYNMATWVQFPEPIDFTVDDGYTYVFHIFIDEVTRVSRIGDFADINENWINMLRFGQKGDYDTRLEWFVGPNGCRKQLYSAALEAQTWYQIALVYEIGVGYRFYVEGELQDSYELTESDLTTMESLVSPAFQAIEFNSSWGAGYRNGNEFHGRLWHFGVVNWALSQSWIKNYFYHDFHSAILSNSYYGLMAYWAFDEGYGHVAYDGIGRYYDIDFSDTIRCDDESSMVSADVSEYVQWKSDSYNDFGE